MDVVASVCVEDELGVQAFCQHRLTGDVGLEDNRPQAHRDAGWQGTLGGQGLQIEIPLICDKDDNRHAAQRRGGSQ
jgi:hypothetical protein